MRRTLTIITLICALALLATSAAAAPLDRPRERGCAVEFRAVRGFNEPVPDLTVMVDFDYESYRTSEDWVRFTIPFDGYRHGVNLLMPDVGIVWHASMSCARPGGVIRIEAPIE